MKYEVQDRLLTIDSNEYRDSSKISDFAVNLADAFQIDIRERKDKRRVYNDLLSKIKNKNLVIVE